MKFAYLIEPPFNFIDESGYITGHDVELARHVIAKLGETFEPIETEFAELIPGLSNGKWNMTTGLFATEERKQQALFTKPIWALPDGLLVKRGNPLSLSGYSSVASSNKAILAVIRDQFQHRSAVEFNVLEQRLRIFETYTEAAQAVNDGLVDAYASVGRAHTGFIEQKPEWTIENVNVPYAEKAPSFGCLALPKEQVDLCATINKILDDYLFSDQYKRMAFDYGFSESEIKLVLNKSL